MADPGGDAQRLRVGLPLAAALTLPGAEVVLRGDRRQAWRAMIPSLPFVALAAFSAVAGSLAAAVYLAFFASSWAPRAAWWRATGGSVQVISTDEVLISVQGGRVRRWVRWSDVDEILLLRPSWTDPWQRSPRGAAVSRRPRETGTSSGCGPSRGRASSPSTNGASGVGDVSPTVAPGQSPAPARMSR